MKWKRVRFYLLHVSVYWYLVIECEEQDNLLQKDDKVQEMFELVLKRFKFILRRGPPEFRERLQFLERQNVFVDKLVQLVKAVARESGNRKVGKYTL